MRGVQIRLFIGVLGYVGETVPAMRVVEYALVFVGAVWNTLRLPGALQCAGVSFKSA